MVKSWGMSETVGFVAHSAEPGNATSERMAWLIDEEVRRLTEEGMDRAKRLLAANRAALVSISEALLERETLTGTEIAGMAEVRLETEAA